MKIAIVGGGISGLSVATFLDFRSDISVFEASATVGGMTKSQTGEGVIRDLGANGFLNDEPAMDLLLERLNLKNQCVLAQGGSRYLLHQGQPIALPVKPPGILTSPLLPVLARLRLLIEPFKKVRKNEQSVSDYLGHRIGKGATAALADAMVSGIWAGDIQVLSMQAAFPRLVKAVETEGSLYKALKAKRASGTPVAELTSLPNGLGQIAETISERLGNQLHTQTAVSSLTQRDGKWVLGTSQGEQVAEQVVLALPTRACAELLNQLAPDASSALLEIPTAPVAVVHHLFDLTDWKAPTGFGILCPRKEKTSTLGILYTSSIFPQRAPPGKVLLRSILGGATNPEFCDQDPQEIQRIALENLKAILGDCPAPLKQTVVIYKRGIPQYTIGHSERVAQIRAALKPFPSLHLAGNFLGGVAVKDCVRVAHEVSLQIRQGDPSSWENRT
jgi:oxygen-dependent protoporphyrinogen oxidase